MSFFGTKKDDVEDVLGEEATVDPEEQLKVVREIFVVTFIRHDIGNCEGKRNDFCP